MTETAAIPERTLGKSFRYAAGYAILIAVMLVSPLFVFLPAALFHCIVRNGRRITWASLFIGTALAGIIAVAGANTPQVTQNEANTGLAYLVGLVLAVALPAMAVAPMVERTESFGRILLVAAVLAGVTPLATGMPQRVGANLLAIVAFLYLLQGLAIFRSFLAAAGAGFSGVFFAYLLLGVLTITGIGPLVLSIAGLFDSFFDFRKFNRKDHSDESHSD